MKGIKAEKPQSIILEDEDKSECLVPTYDDIDTVNIKKGHDFYILLHRMKNELEGIAQDLVLLCNTTVFEESDLQSIKDRLKIKEIYQIQSKELVCLIKTQGLTRPIRYFKEPFEVHFESGGGLIGESNYGIIIYWRGALKIINKKAIQWRKINLRN